MNVIPYGRFYVSAHVSKDLYEVTDRADNSRENVSSAYIRKCQRLGIPIAGLDPNTNAITVVELTENGFRPVSRNDNVKMINEIGAGTGSVPCNQLMAKMRLEVLNSLRKVNVCVDAKDPNYGNSLLALCADCSCIRDARKLLKEQGNNNQTLEKIRGLLVDKIVTNSVNEVIESAGLYGGKPTGILTPEHNRQALLPTLQNNICIVIANKTKKDAVYTGDCSVRTPFTCYIGTTNRNKLTLIYGEAVIKAMQLTSMLLTRAASDYKPPTEAQIEARKKAEVTKKKAGYINVYSANLRVRVSRSNSKYELSTQMYSLNAKNLYMVIPLDSYDAMKLFKDSLSANGGYITATGNDNTFDTRVFEYLADQLTVNKAVTIPMLESVNSMFGLNLSVNDVDEIYSSNL